MPQEHSTLYSRFVKANILGEKCLNPDDLKDWVLGQSIVDSAAWQMSSDITALSSGLGAGFYEQLSDLLRETNDAQFGIVSKLNDAGQWVRDATDAISLALRMPHDSPVIEANNTLLRCLSRLRAIDYALVRKFKVAEFGGLRETLKVKLAQLVHDILSVSQIHTDRDEDKLRFFEQQETAFDTFLMQTLHEADLSTGCKTQVDAEALLSHYRHLSSLLVPARPLVTLTYDKQARLLLRETQYPVTQKTPAQKVALEALNVLIPHPLPDEKTSQTIRPVAFQEVNSLFLPLERDDKRSLPAQSRKTNLVGLKNAFLVKMELFDHSGQSSAGPLIASPEDTFWLARAASPVYLGKGESPERIQSHTRENLTQILMAAQDHISSAINRVHVTGLITDISHEKQDIIVANLHEAGHPFSLVPTNLVGTFYEGHVSDGESISPQPLQKAERLQCAVTVTMGAMHPETISMVICASGQDRTGTLVEATKQAWMRQRYLQKGRPLDQIDQSSAEGGNAAEIATHHVPGSPGMKNESMAGDTFSPLATREFYRHSADTNKNNPVGPIDFNMPSQLAVQAFDAQWRAFFKAIPAIDYRGRPKREALFLAAKTIYNDIDKMIARNPRQLKSTELYDLRMILYYSNQVLKYINEPNQSSGFESSLKRLAGIAKYMNKKDGVIYKRLGQALLVFISAALLIVGLMMVPSPAGLLFITAAAASATSLGFYSAPNAKLSLAKDISIFHKASQDQSILSSPRDGDNAEGEGKLPKAPQ